MNAYCFMIETMLCSDLGEYYSLKNAIPIPSGDDLNAYIDFGNYVSQSAAISATLKNCPAQNGGFTLHVERVTGGIDGNYCKQKIIYNAKASTEFWRTKAGANSWGEWVSPLTNADIESTQQSVTKTIASETSLATVATYKATKDENIMVGVYAGFAQNYTGIRSLGIYKGGTPIAIDKGPASDGEGSHQSSAFANIHLSAGESINIVVQQNSGTGLSVTFVINSTQKFTFK